MKYIEDYIDKNVVIHFNKKNAFKLIPLLNKVFTGLSKFNITNPSNYYITLESNNRDSITSMLFGKTIYEADDFIDSDNNYEIY